MRFVTRRLSAGLSAHQAAWSDGRPQEGIRLLRDRLKQEPVRELRVELADMLLGVGSYEEVVAVANEVLKEESGCAHALFQRGQAKERMGKVEEAVADYQQCVKQEKHAGALLRLGVRSEDVSLLEAALGECDEPDDKADVLFERARLKQRKGDGDGALIDYERAIVAVDSYAPAYFGRGDVLLAKGEYLRALHNYDRFWELHTRFYSSRPELEASSFSDESVMELCVKKAACYCGLQMWEMAGNAAETAQEIGVPGKQMALACYYRGRAHNGEGDEEAALREMVASLCSGVELRAARLLHDDLTARRAERVAESKS